MTGEPVLPAGGVEVAERDDVTTEVSGEAVLIVEAVFERCVVLFTAAVSALVADSTMIVVRVTEVWEGIVGASVLEMGAFGDVFDVLVTPTEVLAFGEVEVEALLVIACELASVLLAKVVVVEGDGFDVADLVDATTEVFGGVEVSLLVALVVFTMVEGKGLLVW